MELPGASMLKFFPRSQITNVPHCFNPFLCNGFIRLNILLSSERTVGLSHFPLKTQQRQNKWLTKQSKASLQVFTGHETPDRIWASLFFLACKMPFKWPKNFLSGESGGWNHGAKVVLPSFWCVVNCTMPTAEAVRWESENFILLSFTFDYTLGVPITVLYHLYLLESWLLMIDFFFLVNLINYLKYFINPVPSYYIHLVGGSWEILLKTQLYPSILKIPVCKSNLIFVISVCWKS